MHESLDRKHTQGMVVTHPISMQISRNKTLKAMEPNRRCA